MTDPIGTAQERELIERVAKAIYHTTPDLCSWDDLFEVVRERGRVKARAAIEAAGVQSRIAEVERLTARVGELEQKQRTAQWEEAVFHCWWNDGDDLKAVVPSMKARLELYAKFVQHLNEARAALSQHRKL